MVELTPDLLGDLKLLRYVRSEIDEHQREIKRLEEMAEDAKERVQAVMGEDEEASLDGKPAVRWRHIEYDALNEKLVQEKFPTVADACKRRVEYRKFEVLPE